MFKYLKKILGGDYSLRSYKVSYSVTLKNLSDLPNSVFVALPTPLRSDYQSIKSEPVFSGGYKKIHEGRFSNELVLWQETLGRKAERSWTESFEVLVRSRRVEIPTSATLTDYKNRESIHLLPGKHLNGQDERIHKLAKSILGGETNLKIVLKKIYEYVVNNLKYGNPIDDLYSFEEALSGKPVDCGGFDSLLGSLYMSLGIPARIVSGFWAGEMEVQAHKKMHAWLEILLPNDVWFPLDPSVDYLRRQGRTKKSGGFGEVGSDRIAFSVGSDIPLRIGDTEKTYDIFQHPIVVAQHGEHSIKISSVFSVKR
ncbi:MAG: hypothetical protein A3E61_02055 [Candidatus Colwellbacteria bacterium RIFCSPHIGHO2_12_FULL_43_12]|uniref:Transglutaminase-like domain-containing protein n=2 Tax=Candidatus Colwelliibacteriota TaxID=1817904 RepID=A0A1G1Z518_9BACT|nr:MAG: hypothetical protein A3E61_02055 [Candidatus Colwellbacteria bacterium RIFCSPHIGHO2_12_FULL_43_12]OGY60985.1 MAG: hypothetical protein A3F99_00335 [Candidatus Colwellbacteria bacterium RIFCSPLOWO2_12_FULL_43_11]